MKSPNPAISVAIIARNAAVQIHDTLHSLRPLQAEVVVLDTGSTDTTAEAAALGGAQVVRHLWDDHFSSARNALLPHLRGSWILWLDAGETITPEDAQLLRQFVEQDADDSRAYYLRVATPPAAGQIGGEQIARLRLHPNRPGLIFHGRVRESLHRSLDAFNLAAEHLPLTIYRSMAEHDPAIKAARAQRNIRLADLQIAQRGPTADLLNCLGEAFQAIGDPARAEQHYRRAQELSPAHSTEMLEAYYGLLTCLSGPSFAAEQMQVCLAAIEQFPLDAQLLCALGGYLQTANRLEFAIRSFTLAAEHGQVNAQLWHLPEIREIATSCQAQLLVQNGQIEAAMLALDQALARYPHSLRLQVQKQKLMNAQHTPIAEAETLRGVTEHQAERMRIDDSAASSLLGPRLHSAPGQGKSRISQR